MFQEVSSALILTALFLVTAVSTSPVALDASLKLEWDSWKNTHGKTYSHKREDMERSMVWLNNRMLIETHNTMAEGSSYSVAMNEFGDMVGY